MFRLFTPTGTIFNTILFYEIKTEKTCVIRALEISSQKISWVRHTNTSDIEKLESFALLKVEDLPLIPDFVKKGFDNVTITNDRWFFT
jgi:hypothetical protein